MNPVLVRVVAGLVRHGLSWLSAWMLSKGIASGEDLEAVIGWVALGVITIGSFLWQEFQAWRVRRQAAATTVQQGTRLLSGLVLLSALGLSSGCASMQAYRTPAPSQAQIDAVRRDADRVVDVVTIVVSGLNELGSAIDTLPIEPSTKDRYDCLVLALVGTSTPASPTVQRVCGSVPLSDVAPLTLMLDELEAVTTCPGLRSVVSRFYGWVSPAVTQLAAAENPTVRMAGASVRIALTLLSAGGATCSAN